MSDSSSIGPQGEPTPPSSHHPDKSSPTSPINFTGPDTPLTPLNEASNHGDVLKKVANQHGIVCMFQADCDTNSQLRKAISHIFGRNKMCTRLVPADVWVHYCRKHYQRSRYRNPKEYAKLQCDLVQKQIRRIHDWSLGNQQRGLPGVVQDWGLAVRKREQKRIDELSGAKRKRSGSQFDDSEDDDNSTLPATAVPRWLRTLCGKGYDTHSILNIFNRLHTEILADMMPQFPDIEILPNITTESEEPQQPKGYAKRAVAATGHKRSQSLGVGQTAGFHSPVAGHVQQPGWGSADGIPVQKRQRRNMEAAAERVVQPLGRRSLGNHRYPSIAENQIEAGEMRPHPNAYQPHLVAPTPQRLGGYSMAAHLETSSARRSNHNRSRSDMGGLSRNNEMYAASQYAPSSAHPSSMGSYGPSRYQQPQPSAFPFNAPQQHRGQPFQTPPHHGNMMSSKHLPNVGHSRHQSTPMAHFHHSPASMARDGLPAVNPHMGSSHAIPPISQMAESADAAMYRERR